MSFALTQLLPKVTIEIILDYTGIDYLVTLAQAELRGKKVEVVNLENIISLLEQSDKEEDFQFSLFLSHKLSLHILFSTLGEVLSNHIKLKFGPLSLKACLPEIKDLTASYINTPKIKWELTRALVQLQPNQFESVLGKRLSISNKGREVLKSAEIAREIRELFPKHSASWEKLDSRDSETIGEISKGNPLLTAHAITTALKPFSPPKVEQFLTFLLKKPEFSDTFHNKLLEEAQSNWSFANISNVTQKLD
jgi:hypothetical protein